MDAGRLLTTLGFLWSPLTFSALVALAVGLVWAAVAPARPRRSLQGRLGEHMDGAQEISTSELDRPIAARTIVPTIRSVLRFLGRLLPGRDAEHTRQTLEQAGYPLGLSVIDFYGLRILILFMLCAGFYLLVGRTMELQIALLIVAFLGLVAYMLPGLWLKSRAKSRKHQALLAFPDALDMLTIGVEAGLAFESAMLRVGEKWDNVLTREFRRTVAEMRIGVGRDEALTRMGERIGLDEVKAFVSVLVQSSALGVSIAQVLHGQAADVRTKRSMRAEEQARKAGTKMMIPLVFLIFPTLFVVILGPAVPILIETFSHVN